MKECNILDNQEYAFYVTSKNDSTTIINTNNNWWGTDDSTAIESMMLHNIDSSKLPIIDYMPYAISLFDIDDTITTDIHESFDDIMPVEFILHQNYPNPFNPITNIQFAIMRKADVKISLFDVLGREVDILINERLGVGNFTVFFDGSNYKSGVYFYKLEAEYFTDSKKMILLK